MTILFPPVIESRAVAFPFYSAEEGSNYYDIQFPMPSINSVKDIRHIQVSIKYLNTGKPAVNSNYAPDGQTIFISADSDWFTQLKNGNYRVRLPYKVFEHGFPTKGETYMFQVRFGSNTLWTTGDGLGDRQDFSLFAAWRQASVTQIPSYFGEWSNIQKAYCYGSLASNDCGYNLDDFMPEVWWTYAPENGVDDPVEQVMVKYVYDSFDGQEIKSQVFNGQYNDDNTFTLRAKLPIAPVKPITAHIEAVTKNNAIWTNVVPIPSLLTSNFIKENYGKLEDFSLTSREQEDGVIAKTLTLPSDLGQVRINAYRINCLTLQCLKIMDAEEVVTGEELTFKDFTVEMGEDYQYVFCSLEEDGNAVKYLLTPLTPFGPKNPGYGRLMRMEASYITSRKHQLRLHGNVTLSNFKKNVQDNFQTTIGGKYPFYSRASNIGYRSFSLSGVVSINFDPTSAFMRFDAVGKIKLFDILSNDQYKTLTKYSPGVAKFFKVYETGDKTKTEWQFVGADENRDHMTIEASEILVNHCSAALCLNGLWWDDEETGQSSLVLQDRDIFETQQVSLSRKRMGNSKDDSNWTKAHLEGVSSENDGAHSNSISIYDKYLHRQSGMAYGTVLTDELVYIERKFREKAMDWLTDGKPKLFRSETEGNMIVILSGVSFAPLERTNRAVYTLSCTVTEIAEFNGDNLLAYNLAPCDIRSIYIDPDIYGYTWGDFDPYVDNSLKFYFDDKFAIPNMMLNNADGKISIPTYSGVVGGVPPYSFFAKDLPKGFTVKERDEAGTDDDVLPGTISGYPTGTTTIPPSFFILTVRDSEGAEASIQVPYGYLYEKLVVDAPIPLLPVTGDTLLVGQPIKEQQIMDYFHGGVAPFKITGDNLPSGITVRTQGSVLWGNFTGVNSASTGDTFVNVVDSVGQEISIPVTYGKVIYGLSFQKLQHFDFDYTEVGVPIDPLDVTVGVSGGINGDKTKYRYYCNSIAYPLPKGWQISNGNARDEVGNIVPKGTIFGIPEEHHGSGQFEVTVEDEKGNTKSILINYNTILEHFEYIPDVTFYVDQPPATLAQYPPDIQIGTTISTKKTISGVHGGLRFTEGSPYRFEAVGLLPNFQINNQGEINGRAQIAIPKHTATLYAIDARGKRVSCEIKVGKISSFLEFPHAGYLIKNLHVGKEIADANIFTMIGGVANLRIDNVSGGTPYNVIPEYHCVASGFPKGLGVKYVENPSSKSGGWYFTGTPQEVSQTVDGWLLFSDSVGNKIQVQVRFEPIYGDLVWNGGDTRKVITGQPGEEFRYKVTGLSGGQPGYEILISDLGNSENGVVHYEYGTANDITSLYLVGTLPTTLNKETNFDVTVYDNGRSSMARGHFTLKSTQPPLSITKIRDFAKTIMLTNHAVLRDVKVMKVEGGDPGPNGSGYSFTVGGGNTICGGINLTIVKEGDEYYIVANGTPTTVSAVQDLAPSMVIRDAGGREGSMRFSWYSPDVRVQPKISDAIGGNEAMLTKDYQETTIKYNAPWVSPVYFDSMSIAGCSVKYEGSLPETVNGQVRNERYSLGGIITNIDGKASKVKFTLSVPRLEFDEPIEKIVNVDFAAVQTGMTYSKDPIDLKIKGLAINKKMDDLTVSDGLKNGVGPFKWVASGLPEGLEIKWDATDTRKAWIQGTPTKEIEAGQVTITVTDTGDNNNRKSIQISFGGVYPPIKINKTITVPDMTGGQPLTAVSFAGAAAGGKGTLTYTDTDQFLASYGYYIDGETIVGTATNVSKVKKTGYIYVSDEAQQTEKIQVTLGKITGDLSFDKTVTPGGPYSLPQKKKGTVLSAAERPRLYNGALGGKAPYKFEESPTGGWKDHDFTITMNAQGEMTYVKYPATKRDPGSFKVRLVDSAGTPIVIDIDYGRVTDT